MNQQDPSNATAFSAAGQGSAPTPPPEVDESGGEQRGSDSEGDDGGRRMLALVHDDADRRIETASDGASLYCKLINKRDPGPPVHIALTHEAVVAIATMLDVHLAMPTLRANGGRLYAGDFPPPDTLDEATQKTLWRGPPTGLDQGFPARTSG